MHYILFAFLLLFSLSLQASEFTGTVTKVWDGDSFVVKTKSREMQIRLAHIDAPEKEQPHGETAKQALISLLQNKRVTIKPVTTDRYKRTVAYTYVNGLNINHFMVKQGHAWVYRKYAKDPQIMLFEIQARLSEKGLWNNSKPIQPWRWRREH